MPSPKICAARSIAKALRPAEDTIDQSIAAMADLVGSIARGRLAAGVAAEVGHDGFMHAARAITLLHDARDAAVLCHRALDQTRADEQVDPSEAGCVPFKTPMVAAPQRLRAVGG